MHCTVHCLRVNPMFYHFPTYLLLSSIVFLSMLCWTSCSHNFVLLVVLYIVVVPPCYAFEPSVMCGNHQKVDNTEAAERLALVEPQLSPEKVVSLFDKFHTHTIISSDFPVFPVSVFEKQELFLLSKGHAATIEDLKVFQSSDRCLHR